MIAVMVLMSFLQVVLRQFFDTGVLWGDTFLRHLVLWTGFLGAAIASAQDKHFAFELAAHTLPEKPRAALSAAAHLAAAAISALLARAAWTYFLDEKSSGSVLFTAGRVEVPSWTFSLILPGGFGLIALHLAIRAVLAAASLRGEGGR